VSDELFDIKENDKLNEDKDPLDIKQRLFLQYYIENIASNVNGAKVRSYMKAYLESTPEDSPEQYHGAKVSAVAAWRMIEKRMGFSRLAAEMGLDNWHLIGKLKELMGTQRPMMKKDGESGGQEPVWYADGPTQLKATTTLISLANELANETGKDKAPTLNVVFSKSDEMDNVEVFLPKKDGELVSEGGQTE
jgi:hypothetical protein